MFRESMIDPLARFRTIDEKVDTLREAVDHVRDARELIRASEASEMRERALREDVLDFLDHATRQAANVIKDLQENKTTLTDSRVRREMLDFLDHTKAVAERLINDLKNERKKILQRAQATLKTNKNEGQKAPAKRAASGAPPPARSAGAAPRGHAKAPKSDTAKERAPKATAAPRKANEQANDSLKSIVNQPSRRKR